ncbi:PQQ-dependent sugar dehydrogenase [Prosthecobacter sp.]|uniref:PQQ-dependent sugar dehydrogenase n=1 Tax=Prosthecobacter sp. TaxID=1965333 RepID=UPI001D98A02F|nr:PQQ-dependent sugar dehydrogenase [Prosthecobacter sp.]MCB1278510.1 PQQ-dependent sugar dehydrogenase [Prosthecobacter sp.]
MKKIPCSRLWLPGLTLAAFFCADSSRCHAVSETEAPKAVTDVPGIPPLEIPEDQMPGLVLRKLAFDREFDSPVMLATRPDDSGEQVVAMQRGEFCAVRLDGSGHGRPFLDFREKMKTLLLFEEGVHGIAFHPRFAENGLFYLSYSQNDPRRTVISEMRVSKSPNPVALPETERVILEIPQPLADHWGGHIAFGPDGMLYIALGDGGLRDDPYRLAQNPWVLHGKILRIDVNSRSGALPYAIPADNPFAKEQTVRGEIFALGFRNPWGLSFDARSGQLWCADVGQDLWEEINRVERGANYGWSDRDGPAKSFFHEHGYLPNLVTTDPVHAYTRMRGEGICIVGGLLYRGKKLPQLDGSFVFADWGFGTVWALGIDAASGRASRRSVLYRKSADHKFNPTLVASDPEGEPVLLSQEGTMYRLETEAP